MTASLDPLAGHDLSGLYGREWQLAQLAADFGRVRSERTFGVSVVHGPSGIGKSALLARFLADPSMGDATVISARADQYGGDAPYAALVDGMRALVVDILGQSDAAVAHWRGRIGAGMMDPELTLALVPELALLLEGAALHPPQASPDGGGRLAAAVLRLLRAFASAERPLIIVVDDAHWLDPAAATLLEQIVGMAADLPVMLLIATRPRAGGALDAAAGLGRRLASRAAYYRELAVETLSVTWSRCWPIPSMARSRSWNSLAAWCITRRAGTRISCGSSCRGWPTAAWRTTGRKAGSSTSPGYGGAHSRTTCWAWPCRA
jgi:hypothetical protein